MNNKLEFYEMMFLLFGIFVKFNQNEFEEATIF